MIFYKFESMGNDFIVVYKEKIDLQKINILCKQHFSIGADGIIILKKSPKYDMAMEIYNADGSKAKMCGNGLKIVAFFLKKILKYPQDEFTVIVNDKQIANVGMINEQCYVLIDYPRFIKRVDNYYIYEIGNTHAIKNVEYISRSELLKDAKKESLKGMNITNISLDDSENVRIQTYENGVGLTNSCGSASLCSFAYLNDRGVINKKITFHSLGGVYDIEIFANKLCLYGKVNFIYKGETTDEL